jgi:hypothetical protein
MLKEDAACAFRNFFYTMSRFSIASPSRAFFARLAKTLFWLKPSAFDGAADSNNPVAKRWRMYKTISTLSAGGTGLGLFCFSIPSPTNGFAGKFKCNKAAGSAVFPEGRAGSGWAHHLGRKVEGKAGSSLFWLTRLV